MINATDRKLWRPSPPSALSGLAQPEEVATKSDKAESVD